MNGKVVIAAESAKKTFYSRNNDLNGQIKITKIDEAKVKRAITS